MASKPTIELPCFRVMLDITLVARDHDEALAWAADASECVFDEEAVLSMSAHVPQEPVDENTAFDWEQQEC